MIATLSEIKMMPTSTRDGRHWGLAKPMPFGWPGVARRIRAAWWVLAGRGEVVAYEEWERRINRRVKRDNQTI